MAKTAQAEEIVPVDNGFPDKWSKRLPQGYTDTVESMSSDDLQKEVLKAEGSISDTEQSMENDEKLQVLKDDVKVLAGGYKDLINTDKAKVKYCLHVMRLRGLR